ncbi:MAG: HAMP domain-containing histidine kinase [Defluviitaleaceae bacterium]|nr:HAMP domain-containing histidine kinase [Defluviitaleaceae bacterium]
MPLKPIQRNLRTSILAIFSVLLFLSFFLVGAAFNFAVNQYIQSSAIASLNEQKLIHYDLFELSPEEASSFFDVNRRGNFFRTNLRIFVLNDEYQILDRDASDAAISIATALEQGELAPAQIQNLRMRIQDQTFFIAAGTNPAASQERHLIFYVDVTDLQNFTRSINMLLLSLAGIMWLVAMIITSFLAGYLSRPLRILSHFARRIGQGDFTANPISFADEEFETLNQNLNHAAKQLAKYDNDQKIFFQNVSHDLRTPLMTIESYAEGIKYGLMDPNKATQTILEATGRLSNMVDDVLYISRIDNITVPAMEQTDINMLIQERINQQRPLAERKDLVLEYIAPSTPLIINCAISYMSRALDNLISNALRFAKTTVTVECLTSNNHVIICVTDDGPGFEPEILPHVFERFYKGKNGLNGIGLSVVRSIMEQHKGTALAENGEVGAKLTISIPCNTNPHLKNEDLQKRSMTNVISSGRICKN